MAVPKAFIKVWEAMRLPKKGEPKYRNFGLMSFDFDGRKQTFIVQITSENLDDPEPEHIKPIAMMLDKEMAAQVHEVLVDGDEHDHRDEDDEDDEDEDSDDDGTYKD